MSNIKSSHCPFSAKHCKYCANLYCSDREYETPTVTVLPYKTLNMEQKLTAQEIVERLIDEQKISGKEAVILLNAINKQAEVRIEKEYVPYTPPIITTPWYQQDIKCDDPRGTYTAATREISNPVEPTMKEEPKKGTSYEESV